MCQYWTSSLSPYSLPLLLGHMGTMSIRIGCLLGAQDPCLAGGQGAGAAPQ